MGKDTRELMMMLMVVVKCNLNLILLLPLHLWFRAILDERRMCVYSVPIGPGMISLYDQQLLVTYLG